MTPHSPTLRHPRESGDPVASDGATRADWAPAFAGVTKWG